MSVHIEVLESSFSIPIKYKDLAYNDLLEITKSDKRNWICRFGPEPTPTYSEKGDLATLVWEWGWELSEVPFQGTTVFTITGYPDNEGNEVDLWSALAPYVTEGSYIDIMDGDGEFKRYKFNNKEIDWVQLKLVEVE
tara:strand:- start:503 stop:913 length:411 start_codon:yes stop_codon:yes gene_type:complete